MNEIIGSGGKDGGASSARTPVEALDSLRSVAYARVVDIISEGEIEGLVDGLKSIYLDGVPLQSKNGIFNYKDIVANTTTGTQDQAYIPGIPSSEAETAVGVDVKFGVPITQSISDTNATAARVRIGIPALSSTNPTNGDVSGTDVEIQILLQNGGGGYVFQQLDGKGIFSGKCSSMYERDFRIALPAPGPWQIRVNRVTADSVTQNLNNKTYWQTYTTIIDTKLSFPNSAVVMLQLPSEQFNSIPVRSYRIRGIKCKVPTNYNPYTRRYSGTWDGSFKIAWTSNPAWQYYDLITKKRYGIGNSVSEAHLDKWGLYAIAQYNDAFLPSGVPKKHTLTVTTAMNADGATNTITRTAGNFGGNITTTLAGASCSILDGCLYYKKGFGWAAAGFKVGDAITVTGFPTAGNNGGKSIIAIAGDVIRVTNSSLVSSEHATSNTVFSTTVAGDGFLDGDELNLAGWTDPLNNGRAVIKSVVGNKLVLHDSIALMTEASGSRTATVVNFTEPRFACNLYLQTQEDAYKVIGNLASAFQSIIYWSGGSVMLAQDCVRAPEYLFTAANVEGGLFTYSGTARKARHTVAIVTWNDPEDHFKIKYKYVTNEDGLLKYGYRPVQVAGFGNTSEGQAIRVGKWVLRTELKDTQVVSFKTGLEGASRSPGAIIKVLDPYKAGKRYAGRVLSATPTSVQVDGDPIAIEAGHTYTLCCVLPSGLIEEKAVTNVVGSYSTLTTAAFSAAPDPMAIWMLTANDLAPKLYRVLTVNEVEPTKFEIIALDHDPTKFAEVEYGIVVEKTPTSAVEILSPPQGIKATESLYLGPGGQVQGRIDVSWESKIGVNLYKVRWRRNSGNWTELDIAAPHFEIMDAPPGAYEFAVAAYQGTNFSGSAPVSLTALGKSAPPSQVTGFTATLRGITVELKWNPIPDLDADIYEIRVGASWAAGTMLAQVDTTSFSYELTPGASYTLWIKAIDSTGNYSTTAVSATVSLNPTTPTSITVLAL